MNVRPTMGYLVEFSRSLAEAVPGVDMDKVTDSSIEFALDNSRIELRYEPLQPLPTAQGRVLRNLTWEASKPCRWLEEGAVVCDTWYQALSPSSISHREGRFIFDAEPAGGRVLLTGYSYDPYGAIYELLYPEAAKADSKEVQSFTARNGSFSFIRPPHSAAYRVLRKYLSKSRRGMFMSVF